MKKLSFSLLVLVSVLVVFVSSVKAEGYKMVKPAVFTLISGDIPLTEKFKINLTMLHTWSIGGSPSPLYSFLSLPIDVNGTIVSPGIGVATNYDDTGNSAGFAIVSAYGTVAGFVHYSEVDLYFTEKSVDVWATTRWLYQPLSGIPLNIGGQAYLSNNSISAGPELSWSFPHLDAGIQFTVGLLNDKTYYPQIVMRSSF